MEVSGINPAVYAANPQAATQSASGAFGAGDFMQILMTQLTHQNPLEPMSDSEMMNQFAQLNSLQELQTMRTVMDQVSATSQTSYAASLIGKTVKVSRANGDTFEGQVSGVTAENGNLLLMVGEELVPLASVLEILGAQE